MIAGAGNIGEDNTLYVDGEIVHEGTAGESGRGQGEYSAGRGGAGNIVPSPRGSPAPGRGPSAPPAERRSQDVVPEPAMKAGEQYENFHTGRGGEGNIHRDKYGGHSHPQKEKKEGHESLIDKAKHAMGLDRKKGEESPLKEEVKR